MPIIAQAPAAAQVGGLGTTQKIFQNAAGYLPVAANILNIPGSKRLEGIEFTVRASGYVFVHGTTPTVQLILNGNLPGGSNVILAQSAATTLTTNANYPWVVEAWLMADSVSGILHGQFRTVINNTATAPAALTNTLTTVNLALEPPFSCQAGLIFGVTDALNVGQLDSFVVVAD